MGGGMDDDEMVRFGSEGRGGISGGVLWNWVEWVD